MHIKTFFRRISATIITVLMFGSVFVNASGPGMIELHHTVEEARISVTMSDDGQSGTLTASLLECDGCSPQDYTFNSSTLLINQFGAQRPFTELKTWSGNRAMFHYLKANNHIEQIQILP
ncbi:MAG: hypothetical protein JKY14_14080 [Paraglaciecola sp.]|nr:hypothetical protein [Paraglaciecola sp.]